MPHNHGRRRIRSGARELLACSRSLPTTNYCPARTPAKKRSAMRLVARIALLAAAVVLVPALSHAQSISGVVRDASGAILPGVTVEAASPALIERVRSVTTDGSGQYRLETL